MQRALWWQQVWNGKALALKTILYALVYLCSRYYEHYTLHYTTLPLHFFSHTLLQLLISYTQSFSIGGSWMKLHFFPLRKKILWKWMTERSSPLPLISDIDVGSDKCLGKPSKINAFDCNIASWDSIEPGSKFLVIERLLEHLQKMRRKCLIFCEFLSPLILLNATLVKKFPKKAIFFYHGKLDNMERAENLKSF